MRGCRNAGIPVPKEIIDKAVKYIKDGTGPDGGVRYSSQTGGGGGRPPITAAALACLFNAGDYDSEYVPKLLKYCQKNIIDTDRGNQMLSGHWHYAHYYYAQVMYREGGKDWEEYRNKIFRRIVSEASRRRVVDSGLHRTRLHHGHQPDDPSASQGELAHLSTLRYAHARRLVGRPLYCRPLKPLE